MSSSHSSPKSPKRRSTQKRSKSPSRASQNKRTSQEKRASRENRTVKRAMEAFRTLRRSPNSETLDEKDKEASRMAKQMNKNIDVEGHIGPYVQRVVTIIREQLKIVSAILFALHTNRHNQWEEGDIPILKRVKQTLMNALYLIIYTEENYPKDQYPILHNSPQPATVITKAEYEKVDMFYTPVKRVIKNELTKLSKLIYSTFLHRPGGEKLRKQKELLHDVLFVLPHKREIEYLI